MLRAAVYLSNITAWGHSQDFKTFWPAAAMFSDPTRAAPFVLGR